MLLLLLLFVLEVFCLSLLLKRRLKLPLWRFLSFIFCSLISENLAIYLQNLSVPKHHLWHAWLFAQLTSGKDLVLIRTMEMFFFWHEVEVIYGRDIVPFNLQGPQALEKPLPKLARRNTSHFWHEPLVVVELSTAHGKWPHCVTVYGRKWRLVIQRNLSCSL